MKKLLTIALACVMVLGLFAGCGETAPAATEAAVAETEAKAEVITLTVWGPQEDQADENGWLPTMCEQFNEAHPEWDITFQYGVCSEGDAQKNVTADPSAAADVYMYANDQLGTLMQSQAIAQLGGKYLEAVPGPACYAATMRKRAA